MCDILEHNICSQLMHVLLNILYNIPISHIYVHVYILFVIINTQQVIKLTGI